MIFNICFFPQIDVEYKLKCLELQREFRSDQREGFALREKIRLHTQDYVNLSLDQLEMCVTHTRQSHNSLTPV